MLNEFMNEKELQVKEGDRVCICGYHGTVNTVYRGVTDKGPYTNIKVNFDNPKEIGYQYEGGTYGDYTVVS